MDCKFQRLLFSSIVIILSGCASNSEPSLFWENPPCHDGYNISKDGKSKIWLPSTEELTILIAMLPQNRKLYCWHEMPNGEVFVINSDEKGEHYSNVFYKNGSTFIKGAEEIVITISH